MQTATEIAAAWARMRCRERDGACTRLRAEHASMSAHAIRPVTASSVCRVWSYPCDFVDERLVVAVVAAARVAAAATAAATAALTATATAAAGLVATRLITTAILQTHAHLGPQTDRWSSSQCIDSWSDAAARQFNLCLPPLLLSLHASLQRVRAH